jgi:divalent metal cation (Fe/Co/Zn/Cd) transporter
VAGRAPRGVRSSVLRQDGGVSVSELPVLTARAAEPDERWLRAARRARLLSWASLAWMTVEGVVGLLAGFEANSLSVLVWAASSFVEGLASLTIIWRFTGSRLHARTSERTAQRWVAGSFLLLVPYVLWESGSRLVNGSDVDANALGIAVTASAIVLMPLLGWAKLRLARQLDSDATAGEGVQNLLCAGQAAAALVALIGAGAGLAVLDPVAALVISAIAVTECVGLWRGEEDDCCGPVGFGLAPAGASCDDECCVARPPAVPEPASPAALP